MSNPSGKAALIIFGAAVRAGGIPSPALSRRLEAAMQIAAENPEAYFIVTGGTGDFPPSEAEVMKRELMRRGIPAGQIYTEDIAKNTFDSVLRVMPIVSGLPTKPSKVLVITDTYHQWRCRMLLFLVGIPTRHSRLLSGYSSNGILFWGLLYLRELLAAPKDLLMLAIWRCSRRK
jgi:uncharacterized SAM-binding protein YcdF (DUF218 family)